MSKPAGHRYSASLDTTAIVMTLFVLILFVFIGATYYSALHASAPGIVVAVVVASMVLIFMLSYGFSPKGYLVTDKEIFVLRLFGNKRIERSAVHGVESLNRKDISWSIRLFGVGGLFGYFGRFANRKLGSMTWYLTRRNKTVLLRMKDGRKVLLSPDDNQGFVSELTGL